MRLSNIAKRVQGQPMFRLKQRIRELEAEGRNVIHFEIGDNHRLPPNNAIKATILSLLRGETHYTASNGMIELKKAIVNSTYKEYGIRIQHNKILVLPANSAIDFVIRCVCDADAEVIITDPCFPTYTSVLSYTGITAVPVVLSQANNFKLLADDVIAKVTDKTRLIIINSPSNPTGSIIECVEIKKLVEFCLANEIFLLSDEVYSQMMYSSQQCWSPTHFDHCDTAVILLKSFSKTYSMPGYRLGYVIANEQLIEKMGLLFQTIFSCMPVFVQRAGISALENGQRYVNQNLRYLKGCRDLMVEGLNEIPNVSCNIPEGAFYVFPDISETGLTGEWFAHKLLEEQGVAVLPGINFGDSGMFNIRICYATEKKNIKEGLKRIRKFLCT